MTLAAEQVVAYDIADAALAAMAAELGDDAVLRTPGEVSEFRDPYRYSGAPSRGPSGVVHPSSTEQVQTVLRIANEFRVPVWTNSQGRNYGYGGAEPRVPGSIVLNLRRMNRVLEIDTERGVAVVEPGVSFFDLYDALQQSEGPRYLISCPDLGWGSVIGNALDHGVGYTPMGDHTASLCGLEVVLPGGEVIRTGMGAVADSPNWHVYHKGFGPSVEGLFAQSNLGVVTRAGVWLHPEPETYSAGMIMVQREEDLEELVDTLRPLMLDGTVQGYPLIVHSFGPMSMFLPREQWPGLTGSGTDAQLEPVRRAMGFGAWSMRLSLYGPQEIVAAKRTRIERAFGEIADSTVMFTDYEAPYTRESVAPPDQVPIGIPGMDVLNALNAWGGPDRGGHVDYSPVSPMTGRDAMNVYRTLWQTFAERDVTSIYSLIARERSLLHVNMIMFDRDDEAGVAASNGAVTDLIERMHEFGFSEYRAHPDFADQVADKFSFQGHSLRDFQRTLKDALDPRGILSPGRQGIWPTYTATPDEQDTTWTQH